MVCAQAMSGRWWTAEVFHDNMDYTYFLLVQDDVHTQWPRVHWADILDKSCADFYQAELDKEGQGYMHLDVTQQQQQHFEQQQFEQQQFEQQQFEQQQVEQQQFEQQQQQQEQEQQQELPQEVEQQEQKESGRWSAAKLKKKKPWAVISAAAVAGTVPILYHLTG